MPRISASLLFLFLSLNVFAGGDQVRKALNRDPMRQSYQDSIRSTEKLRDSIRQQIAATVKKGGRVDSSELKVIEAKLEQFKSFEGQLTIINSEDVQQDKLSYAVLIFGLILIFCLLLFQTIKGIGLTQMTAKLIGVIFIGTLSVFLVPAGFDNLQITPVVGLLGTLAGYLIGSSQSSQPSQPSQPTQTATSPGRS